MTEAEKYHLINGCETVKELEDAIGKIADDGFIHGRTKVMNASSMQEKVQGVVNGSLPARVLTRVYGIRQQALYIKYYQDLERKGPDKDIFDFMNNFFNK